MLAPASIDHLLQGSDMPSNQTGEMRASGFRSMRRPNPVFSAEYELIRSIVVTSRVKAGVTQRSLAKRLGKSNSHVSLIERGQRRIDCLELYKIAQALSIDPEVLFREIAESLKAAA